MIKTLGKMNVDQLIEAFLRGKEATDFFEKEFHISEDRQKELIKHMADVIQWQWNNKDENVYKSVAMMSRHCKTDEEKTVFMFLYGRVIRALLEF